MEMTKNVDTKVQFWTKKVVFFIMQY